MKNIILKFMINKIRHYNHYQYWKMREVVVNKNNKAPAIIKMIYLYKIKKSDAFNNASMGTHFNYGANFVTPPICLII